jgi:hypothetical protein
MRKKFLVDKKVQPFRFTDLPILSWEINHKSLKKYKMMDNSLLLSISGTSVQECMEELNRDLKNLSKWLKFNKLKMNVSKTKYIIMSGRRSNIENGSTSLIIDGAQIANGDNGEIFGC